MKTRLSAILVIATILCVLNAEGGPQFAPPERLNIGSLQAIRDGSVTGRVWSITSSLYFTNSTGNREYVAIFGAQQFATYQDYRMCMVSNTLIMFEKNKSKMVPDTNLRWRTFVGYADDLNAFTSLLYDGYIGRISTVSSNTFMEMLVPTNISFIVPVLGLEKYTIEAIGLYTNCWPVDPSKYYQAPGFTPPAELTTNNIVQIDPRFATGTNEVRFSITAGGRTQRYTQFGDPLDPPTVALVPDNKVFSTFARGAIVSIQETTDLVHWTTFTNFSDKAGVGSISSTYTRDQPRKFFRVGIQ